MLRRMTALGHGLPVPSTARRVRSGISERTVAETRSNREDALIAAISGSRWGEEFRRQPVISLALTSDLGACIFYRGSSLERARAPGPAGAQEAAADRRETGQVPLQTRKQRRHRKPINVVPMSVKVMRFNCEAGRCAGARKLQMKMSRPQRHRGAGFVAAGVSVLDSVASRRTSAAGLSSRKPS